LLSEIEHHRVQIKMLEEYAKKKVDRHIPRLMFGARSFVRATGRILLNHLEEVHPEFTGDLKKLRSILEVAEMEESNAHNGSGQK